MCGKELPSSKHRSSSGIARRDHARLKSQPGTWGSQPEHPLPVAVTPRHSAALALSSFSSCTGMLGNA